MYARSLERTLRQLADKGDFGREAQDAFERRFRALRGCRLLPRGRKNRNQRLTHDEIANAVFSIAAIQPERAGFTAIMLSRLVPAGGPKASFHNSACLIEAVVRLLDCGAARDQLRKLTLSTAEGGFNSSGYAELIYEHPASGLKQVYFVDRLATSLTAPGGEERINPLGRYSTVSRETVLSPRFFHALTHEIKDSMLWPAPSGGGDEYTPEEAEEQRRKKLGVRPMANYLNIGVESFVTWPKEEMLIIFDRYEIVLLPRTRENSASVHIDLKENRLSHTEAKTVVNRLLSVMSWIDDQYAIAQGGWSGNSVPCAVPKREVASATSHVWVFGRCIPDTEEARRAVALYREARSAQQNFLVSYAVLNFYKIIELRHNNERGSTKRWIRDNFNTVEKEYKFDTSFEDLHKARGSLDIEEYLYKACRVAVAHASNKSPSDPDDSNEIRRLHTAAGVLRWMARHFVKVELGVGDRPWER